MTARIKPLHAMLAPKVAAHGMLVEILQDCLAGKVG